MRNNTTQEYDIMKLTGSAFPYISIALLTLSACDPQKNSIDLPTQQAAANGSPSPTFEILDITGNYHGEFDFITIESQGVISNASNGTLANPIKLTNNEPFTIAWGFGIEEQSLLTLEFKNPSNPDKKGGGFFNFNTCLQEGKCTKSSTTCEYYKNTNLSGEVIIGILKCDFIHPDLELPITNSPDFKQVLDTTIDSLPQTFELRANLCAPGVGCTVARVGFVEINMK